MARLTKQQQWLNIIIISISALVLAFVLLGKFMGNNFSNVPGESINVELKAIDFGDRRLTLVEDKNSSISSHWKAVPNDILSQEEINKLITSWRWLLNQSFDSMNKVDDEVISGMTVLVFFKDIDQPMVIRVSDKEHHYLVQFISTQNIISIEKKGRIFLLPLNAQNLVN